VGGGGDGGGSDAPAAPTTAEGLYRGTLSNSSTASVFSAVVLEDRQFWSLYGNTVGGALVVGGHIQGQGTSSNGVFTSSTSKDFGFAPAIAGSLVPRPSGKNIFNFQLNLGPAPCALPGAMGAGIGVYTTLANGMHQLVIASVDVSRTVGSVAVGTR
jgi:hypothetical protein